ncbi:MAG: MFS transporter [Desulfococcus multivorans]|jgi:predicted MFS family arabinose efflux permease|nr:MFS transporter [Desulfococcus multivorans]
MAVQGISRKNLQLARQIGIAFSSRLLINTSRRFIYPFAPALSRGLGVPLTAFTTIIALNQFAGFLSLIFGPLADRWGHRSVMLLGLGVLGTGMLAGGLFPSYWPVFAALVLTGAAKSIFDPAILAFAGTRVPYERRGLAVGLLEMSWAGSSLLGIPLMGVLMDHWGWRAPFFVLGGCSLACMALLARWIPKSGIRRMTHGGPAGFAVALKRLAGERTALGGMLFVFGVSMANDNLFVVYGVWLEKSFGLSLLAIGFATTVIGAAELLGEGFIATLSDRLGLKRSVILGGILSGLSYALLPMMDAGLPLALTGLFLVFLMGEFTIVGSISFFTEILPEARGTMMAGYFVAASMGRVIGALMGGPLWLAGGIWAVAGASVLTSAAGLAGLIWGARHFRR